MKKETKHVGLPVLKRLAQFRFMDRGAERHTQLPMNRGGARLRRVLTDFYRWEIRARRSLPPPFMAPMRVQKWAWRPFMNLRPHRCNLLSHMRQKFVLP